MIKKTLGGFVAASAVLALAACGQAPEEGAGAGAESDYKACMVSDAGGWDDQSFNQSGREGLTKAVDDLGIQEALAQSQADSDYGPNVDSMVQQNCNLIFGVGFLLEDPIQQAAEANPDTNFALIDSSFADADSKPVELENGKPLVFNTAEAAFLAGYLAAAQTKTGTVATFGGMPIPSVQIFMDGFADGVAKFNDDKGKDVKLLGWDKEKQEGSFSGDFENQGQGKTLTEQFISQDADVIMPVAGPVGLGAAAAAKAADGTKIIWVDSDGAKSTEYGDIILTSVMKQISTAVFDTAQQGSEDKFSNEPYVGNLENGGVGLAPYGEFDGEVSGDTKTEIDDLKAQIIDGSLKVETPNAP